jgi:hypothetical protein
VSTESAMKALTPGSQMGDRGWNGRVSRPPPSNGSEPEPFLLAERRLASPGREALAEAVRERLIPGRLGLAALERGIHCLHGQATLCNPAGCDRQVWSVSGCRSGVEQANRPESPGDELWTDAARSLLLGNALGPLPERAESGI